MPHKTINKTELVGLVMEMTYHDSKFIQEIFTFDKGKNTQFIHFQDRLEPDGSRSKEAKLTLELINKSLKKK